MLQKNNSFSCISNFSLILCACFLCIGFFAAVSPSVCAQGISPVENKTTGHTSDGLPEFRIGVSVDLVVLYVSVVDKKNHFISGLEQGIFRVLEDGVEQKIESFSNEDSPVSMGLVLDLSGSMRGKTGRVNDAALALLQAGTPDDEFFLIGFNDDVELLQDFTSDVDDVVDALKNTVLAGKTHLYDAIYLGVEKAQKGTRRRKALVVITDGNDDTSFFTLKETIDRVRESDVQVYCIGITDETPKSGIFSRLSSSETKRYHDALTRLAEESGGNAFFPRDISELRGVADEIAGNLHGQYSIGYFSSNTAHDGAFRSVKIEPVGKKNNDITIRHRNGYFAPMK